MTDLFAYQESGAEWLAARRFAILGDQPRVGKTAQAIRAADMVAAKRISITCPAIAVGVWEQAVEQWGWGLYEADIRSYDGALNKGLARDCDVYIFDEAHRLKNIQSQRTQALLGMASPVRRARHVWALSGTIAPNHAGELFPWLRFAGLFDGGYMDFIQRYCRFFMGDFGPKIMGNNPGRRAELLEMLAPVFLRRTRREVFPGQALPDWRDISLACDVGDSRLLVDNTLLIADDLPTESDHLASLRRMVGETKAGPLAQHLAQQLDGTAEKIAVYAWHTSVMDVLEDGLRHLGVVRIDGSTPAKKRTERVLRFREDASCRVSLGQIIAAGEAVDLSQANRLVLAEMSWSPGHNAQVTARLGGPNQQGTPIIETTTLKGSLDEAVNVVNARRTRALEEIYGEAA